jgi:uncharacterized membrane protein
MNKIKKKKFSEAFLRLHPLHRILIGVGVSAITFLLIPKHVISPILHVTLTWIAFSLTFLATSWVVLLKRTIEQIKRTTTEDDGSKSVVFIMILISSFATLFTVLLLMLSRGENTTQNILNVIASVIGMLLSWCMVHTVFTFHYAHMYYTEIKSEKKSYKGLDFPGSADPDYVDFAYFSFVIGCTFQVSDVVITSQKIRRLVFLHSLLAFALNTFVVALTINIIGGLR